MSLQQMLDFGRDAWKDGEKILKSARYVQREVRPLAAAEASVRPWHELPAVNHSTAAEAAHVCVYACTT